MVESNRNRRELREHSEHESDYRVMERRCQEMTLLSQVREPRV
jgi:hypothetical protein